MNNKKIIAALCAVSMLAASTGVISSAEEALDNNHNVATEVTENETATEVTGNKAETSKRHEMNKKPKAPEVEETHPAEDTEEAAKSDMVLLMCHIL